MTAIFKRELRSYFATPLGYTVIGIAVFFSGILLTAFNLISLSPSLSYLTEEMRLVYAVLIPALSFSLISGEYRSGTYRLLFSLPIKSLHIVLGKFFAMMTLLVIPTVIFAFYPLLLTFFGAVNYVEAYLSLAGLLVFQIAAAALCLFVSSAVKKTWAAIFLSYLLMICLFGVDLLAALLPSGSFIGYFISTVSLFGVADTVGYGIFDYISVIYSFVFAVVFLVLTVRSLDGKRYE